MVNDYAWLRLYGIECALHILCYTCLLNFIYIYGHLKLDTAWGLPPSSYSEEMFSIQKCGMLKSKNEPGRLDGWVWLVLNDIS